MYRIDIFGRKWYTAKEFDKHILSDEFEKEKVVGHPTNCIPYIDFGKWDRDTRAFNEFALPRVVDWVKEVSQKPRSTPLHWRDVDLAVAHELDEFLKAYPKKDYELGPNTYGFRKNVLLPKLMNGRSGIPVDSIPLDLIGILYIPNDSQWDKSTVVCANLDDEAGNNLFFQYKHDDNGNVLSYRIRNFKQPYIARVEFISQSL